MLLLSVKIDKFFIEYKNVRLASLLPECIFLTFRCGLHRRRSAYKTRPHDFHTVAVYFIAALL